MQVFSFTECFDWTSTEEFSRRGSLSCIQNFSTMQCPRQRKWLPPREIPSTESSTIYSTGMYIVIKIAFNAWLLEPDVKSNNGHSNCHSLPRWRRPDRFLLKITFFVYMYAAKLKLPLSSKLNQTTGKLYNKTRLGQLGANISPDRSSLTPQVLIGNF